MNTETKQLLKIALAGLALLAGLFAAFPAAQSRDYKKLDQIGGPLVEVSQVWAREASERDRSTAVFMVLENKTGQDDALVRVSTPYAERADLHETYRNALNVLTMRPVNKIFLKQNTQTVLKPGGLHIFLVGLKQPLNLGMEIPLTLEFENSRKQHVRGKILGRGDESFSFADTTR